MGEQKKDLEKKIFELELDDKTLILPKEISEKYEKKKYLFLLFHKKNKAWKLFMYIGHSTRGCHLLAKFY